MEQKMNFQKIALSVATLSVVAVFTFGFFASTAAAQTTNLIQNPSLETASGAAPANWSKVYWGSVKPTFTYPVAGQDGAKAAQITLSAKTNGDARWQHAAVPVTAGEKYEFTGWYKSNVATEVDVVFTTASGEKYDWLTNLASSGNQWKKVTKTFTVPAGATKASVYHLIINKGTLAIDNYSLKKVSTTPTPPTPTSGMVTLSFDDAWLSHYTAALPILEAAGMKGTFYITTEPLEGGWDGFMTPAQVVSLHQKGHEIAGHTVTHANLTTISGDQIDAEIRNSKTYLENLIGGAVTSLAYPYGAFNDSVIEHTRNAGYTNGRDATGDGHNTAPLNLFSLDSFAPERNTSMAEIKAGIDWAKANNAWYILCLHEINNTGEQYSNTPAQLQEIVDYIKASGVQPVTVKQGVAKLGGN